MCHIASIVHSSFHLIVSSVTATSDNSFYTRHSTGIPQAANGYKKMSLRLLTASSSSIMDLNMTTPNMYEIWFSIQKFFTFEIAWCFLFHPSGAPWMFLTLSLPLWSSSLKATLYFKVKSPHTTFGLYCCLSALCFDFQLQGNLLLLQGN